VAMPHTTEMPKQKRFIYTTGEKPNRRGAKQKRSHIPDAPNRRCAK